MTAGIRSTFLACCETARRLLASAAVADRWDEPSALARMTVGALAGHLMRAVTSVDAYLDREPPSSGQALDAPGYFLSIEGLDDPDLDSELHAAIRARASTEAEVGHAGVVVAWDAAVARLRDRLDGASTDRMLPALGGRVLTLDEYLVTRLVEMLVHADDLAVSVDAETPTFPADAEAAVIGCLVEVGRRRHGSTAVIRALTRRERDAVRALRVL
ncbi:MAG TPA: maleylpyruvate isomerase N-terminal domain-containing protein [Acidimicrobiia bacterium]|nr:maleylpyruvate isomerase N-terminal domain-containing protein [Acidimicrobiia bacterium]